MASDPEALELLSEIRDLLMALPGAIAASIERQHRTPRRLSQADGAALRQLLPVIVAAVQGHPFTLRELAEHATLNIAPAIALRDALVSITSRRLGRLLRRAADVGINGFRITALESTRDGVKWRVECDDRSSQKPARFALPTRVTF